MKGVAFDSTTDECPRGGMTVASELPSQTTKDSSTRAPRYDRDGR